MIEENQLNFEVNETRFANVRHEVIKILNATRREPQSEARFEWMYQANPDGEAVLWVVREKKTDTIAGFAASLPRRMLVDGKPTICWNSADLSVLAAYRRQGLATQLRCATKEATETGRVEFLYGHPNRYSEGAYRQAGYTELGRMVRLAFIVRLQPYLRRYLRGKTISNLAAKLIEPLFDMVQRSRRQTHTYSVHLLDSFGFDDRFDRLFEASSRTARVLGVRDARYLHWRYVMNPAYQTFALVAEEGRDIRGYVLFTVTDGVGHVKDLFPFHDKEIRQDLIGGLIAHALQQRLDSLSFVVLEHNPLIHDLKNFGFKVRDGHSNMFVNAKSNKIIDNIVSNNKNWFLTSGDRDI